MERLTRFEGDVESALARLAKRTPFCDVLVQEHAGGGARADTKTSGVSVAPNMRGAVFRAWGAGAWVEASSSELTAPALTSTVELLERSLAKSPPKGSPPGSPSSVRAERSTRPAKPVGELGAEEILRRVLEALGWLSSQPSIGQAQVRIAWDDESRLYRNSAGARCVQVISRAHFVCVPIAIEGGRSELDYIHAGGEGGTEILSGLSEESAKASAQRARHMLSAKAPPTGEMDVLLDPSVTGLFAHESFGHGTEADQFLRDRSYLKPLLGSEVGPDFLTIADDGAVPGAWGSIYFDDEGYPGKKNRLVEGGRFIGALHDRETASAYSAAPTGNTRRSDFLSRAFVRMTNTYVEPGDRTFDELVKETRNGVLLEHGSSGIEDPLGGQMQLKVQSGRLIENGKVTDLVSSMALSGSVLKFLRAIRGVGRSDKLEIDPGFCGKGHSDYIPVGTGGVYLLSRAVIGPA